MFNMLVVALAPLKSHCYFLKFISQPMPLNQNRKRTYLT